MKNSWCLTLCGRPGVHEGRPGMASSEYTASDAVEDSELKGSCCEVEEWYDLTG